MLRTLTRYPIQSSPSKAKTHGSSRMEPLALLGNAMSPPLTPTYQASSKPWLTHIIN